MSNAKDPSATESRTRLDQVRADLSQGQLSALEEMRQFYVLHGTLLQQEKYRLSRKLGEDHPRVKKLEVGIKQNTKLARGLKVQLEVSKIQVPEVPDGGALVHGRVTDENGRGIAGLTLAGETAQKRRSSILSPTETDGSGYFAFPIDTEVLTRLQKAQVFLAVRSKQAKVLYRDKEPLKLAAGDKLAKQIVLERKILRAKTEGR